MPAPIEDYALIGDCESAALVARDGSIDWLCWPRFDSNACFAALLGSADHGRWQIAPVSRAAHVSRRYREGTLILETDFETADGAATLVDFMPVGGTDSDLVRLVIGRRGRLAMRSELTLRFDYGAAVPWVTRQDDGRVRAIAGPDMVVLQSSVPVHGEGQRTVADFTVDAGATATFALSHSPSHLPVREPIDTARALAQTETFWRGWSGRCAYSGRYDEAVRRSLITLKALTYAPTGGLVAAPTTSLPELIGGPRNWDYRYCWLRDATLTLDGLMLGGYIDEASAWRSWLLNAVAGAPDQLQIMYGIDGERRLPELEVPWLPGYEDSRPVRIGNAAHDQFQLDVYGEILQAIYEARRLGLPAERDAIGPATKLMQFVASAWQRPDDGIWEVRGARRHFVHSKMMAWVAVDRFVRLVEEFSPHDERLLALLPRYRALRAQIHHDVVEHGFDAQQNAFVQAYNGSALDASVLMMPSLGFLPAHDPRVQGTIVAIENRLVRDGFVLRYQTDEAQDGLTGSEGAFLACSFWLVDAYAYSGRRRDAEALFERLLALRNDVGLLSEEFEPRSGRLVGNFPQAFSHLALIHSASVLAHAELTPRSQARTSPSSHAAP